MEEKHNADTKEVKSTIQESTGGKGKWKGNEVHWRRDLERACSTGFWDGKCETNMGSTGTKGSKGKNAGGKGSTWKERVDGCGEVRWRRDLEGACSTGFWEGKCVKKRKV